MWIFHTLLIMVLGNSFSPQVWKQKPEATVDDLEAPSMADADVTPVALRYEDVHQFQKVNRGWAGAGLGWAGWPSFHFSDAGFWSCEFVTVHGAPKRRMGLVPANQQALS